MVVDRDRSESATKVLGGGKDKHNEGKDKDSKKQQKKEKEQGVIKNTKKRNKHIRKIQKMPA